MDILSQDIMYLPGVGPHRKEILGKELGIHTYRDLLEYFPYKYVDRTKLYLISELSQDMPFVQIKGKILSYEEVEMGKRKKRIVAHVTDGHGVVDIVWFNGTKYIYQNYLINKEYIILESLTTSMVGSNSRTLTSMMRVSCNSTTWVYNLSTSQQRE